MLTVLFQVFDIASDSGISRLIFVVTALSEIYILGIWELVSRKVTRAVQHYVSLPSNIDKLIIGAETSNTIGESNKISLD